MRFTRVGSLLLCLSAAACGSSQGAQPTLLVVTPDSRVTPLPTTMGNLNCRPLPEAGPARSHLTFAGPCSFTQTAPVRCVKRGDDFYAYIERKLPGKARLFTTINVEYYTRPGTYPGLTQVYVEVTSGPNIYSWANRTATATVPAGEQGLVLQATDALPWAGTPATGIEGLSGRVACRTPAH
jgi:hypothetical protein